jgi:hypothetical protein
LVFNLKHLFYNSNIDLKAYNQTAPGVLFLPVQLAGLRRLTVFRKLAGFHRLTVFRRLAGFHRLTVFRRLAGFHRLTVLRWLVVRVF